MIKLTPEMESILDEYETFDAAARWCNGMTMGRPPIGPAIQVRLTAGQLAKLDRLAAKAQVSRAEMIRQLVAKAR